MTASNDDKRFPSLQALRDAMCGVGKIDRPKPKPSPGPRLIKGMKQLRDKLKGAKNDGEG